jgi:hypothetical protein
MKAKTYLIYMLLFLSPIIFLGQEKNKMAGEKPFIFPLREVVGQLKQTKTSAIAGISTAFPTGKLISQMVNRMDSIEKISDTVNIYRGAFIPRIRFHLGFSTYTPIKEKWGLKTQFFYEQRGFLMREKIAFHNPFYKYDETILNKQRQCIHNLTFSALANYQATKWLDLYVGGGLSKNISNLDNQVTQILRKDVWINGDKSAENSIPKSKTFYQPNFNRTTVCAIAGVNIPIKKEYAINIFAQYTNNLIKKNQYQNLLVHAGLSYQF